MEVVSAANNTVKVKKEMTTAGKVMIAIILCLAVIVSGLFFGIRAICVAVRTPEPEPVAEVVPTASELMKLLVARGDQLMEVPFSATVQTEKDGLSYYAKYEGYLCVTIDFSNLEEPLIDSQNKTITFMVPEASLCSAQADIDTLRYVLELPKEAGGRADYHVDTLDEASLEAGALSCDRVETYARNGAESATLSLIMPLAAQFRGYTVILI